MNHHSNYTGRCPRTLTDAFGPYARWDVERTPHRGLAKVAVACVFVAVLIIFIASHS